MGASHPDTAAWGPKNENVPHAAREKWKTYRMRLRHVKKICDVKRVDQKKGRQTYRNRSERPPPLYTYGSKQWRGGFFLLLKL